MKIAIAHDHLNFMGGGERTVMMLAVELKADFITAYASPETFSELQKQLGKNLIILSKDKIKTRVARFFWLRFIFWRNRKIFKNYDLIIASAPAATEAVAKYVKLGTVKMTYTHTTPRRVFDQYEMSKKFYPIFLQPFYVVFARFWKWLYLSTIKKYDINIANSENTRQRIIDHTGSDANVVIWPPIMTKKFKWLGQEDYFLSYGRLDEAKRIEIIVKAFQKMPDKKLVVASGGPRLEVVKKLAVGYGNIKILGWVSDNELFDLVGKCQAVVYIPIDEDAGMTHLEANAAGKPVLGVAEGGLIESVIENKTGILVKANPGENDIARAAEIMTKDWCQERKGICKEHAKKYDKEIFFEKMKKIIKGNDSSIPILGIDASRWEDPHFPGEEKRTGAEVVAKNIIESLVPAAQKSGLRTRVYTPRMIKEIPAEIQKIIPAQKQWTRKALAKELKYSPADYFFTPSYYIPKNAPKKSFALIHDIIFKTSPRLYSWRERLMQEFALKNNIKRAKNLIVTSEYTKNEIIKNYNLDDSGWNEKIKIARLGYDRKSDLSRTEEREKSIIYIGRVEKKKSVDVLIKAFLIFKKDHSDWKLNIIGAPGYGYEEIKKTAGNPAENDINFLGHAPEEKKWELLSRAGIFAHPSANEGSCIPLFEAWDASIPAIVADIPIMSELGETACLYFKPSNEKDLAARLNDLADNKNLKEKLTALGTKKLENTSWKNTAEKILNVMLG